MSYLQEIDACPEARQWADDQPDYKTAWEICERGDWMLRIAKKQDVCIRKITLAKVSCARLVQHLMKDERSINALDVAERFGNGLATLEELNDAATAVDATYAADVAAVRREILKKCAKIVRQHINFEDLNMFKGSIYD